MIKTGLKSYWMFIPIPAIILWYFFVHMKNSGTIRSGPVLSVSPSLDPAVPILNNISKTLQLYQAQQSNPGTQSSASINPIPVRHAYPVVHQ